MRPAADGYVIDLQNVTKIYRRRVHALQGVSMELAVGKSLGCWGLMERAKARWSKSWSPLFGRRVPGE